MTNKKTAIHITKEAEDTIIEDCEFVGFDVALKNEGKGTKIVRSIFKNIKLLWPESLFVEIVIGVVIVVIGGYFLKYFGLN